MVTMGRENLMPTVFLSYATKDHYFAELAAIKLEGSGIQLWRDLDSFVRVATGEVESREALLNQSRCWWR